MEKNSENTTDTRPQILSYKIDGNKVWDTRPYRGYIELTSAFKPGDYMIITDRKVKRAVAQKNGSLTFVSLTKSEISELMNKILKLKIENIA